MNEIVGKTVASVGTDTQDSQGKYGAAEELVLTFTDGSKLRVQAANGVVGWVVVPADAKD